MHASHEFTIQYFDVFKIWHEQSNYLAFLSVKNEYQLVSIFEKAKNLGIKCSLFREPDIGDQVTAICLEPSEQTRKLCGNLPLALK